MARASRIVGYVPVGFLAFTAAVAAAAVVGGWTVRSTPPHAGYGIAAADVAPPAVTRTSGYGIDEVGLR